MVGQLVATQPLYPIPEALFHWGPPLGEVAQKVERLVMWISIFPGRSLRAVLQPVELLLSRLVEVVVLEVQPIQSPIRNPSVVKKLKATSTWALEGKVDLAQAVAM